MLWQDGIERIMEYLISRPNKTYGHYNHALTTEDLFREINPKWFKGGHCGSWFKKYFGEGLEKRLAAKIFNTGLYEILLDIINNNVTFVLPTRIGNYGEICAESITGEDFIEMYKKGSFKNIDFVKSNFTANQLFFKYRRRDNTYGKKPIYLHGYLKDKLDELTEQGKQYY